MDIYIPLSEVYNCFFVETAPTHRCDVILHVVKKRVQGFFIVTTLKLVYMIFFTPQKNKCLLLSHKIWFIINFLIISIGIILISNEMILTFLQHLKKVFEKLFEYCVKNDLIFYGIWHKIVFPTHQLTPTPKPVVFVGRFFCSSIL